MSKAIKTSNELFGEIDFTTGSYKNKSGQRKPSLAYKKVSIDTNGKLKIGVALYDTMLEQMGIDPVEFSTRRPEKQYSHILVGIGKKRRGGNGKNSKLTVPYISVFMWETADKAYEVLPAEQHHQVKKIQYDRRNYSNKNQMLHYNDQMKSTTNFQKFYFEKGEELPTAFAIDKSGNRTLEELPITRTDFIWKINADTSAIEISEDIKGTGTFRIWGNEGIYVSNPLHHEPWKAEPKE